MKSCFLLGWHGTINIGDDLMAELYINEVKSKYTYIYSFERYYNIKDNIVLSKYKAFIKMLTADDLMVSGGNIFLISSKKSYLKLLLFFIAFYIRKVLNKPIYIDSIGLDLKVGKVNRYILLKILKQVNTLSVREPLSYRYLRYCKHNITLKYDLELNYDRVYRYSKYLLSKYKTYKHEKNLIWFISGQPANKDKDTNLKTDNILQSLQEEYNISKRNIVFFCQNKKDLDRVEALKKRYSIINKYKIILYDYEKLGEQMNMITSSDIAVVERYHGAIISEAVHLRWYKLAFSEKLERVYIPNQYCLNCKRDKK